MSAPGGHLLSTNPWEFVSWRHVLRAILRECSYLPDPIARSYFNDHVLSRFRRYVIEERRPWIRWEFERQKSLFKEAKYTLSTLKRANEGYPRPLEKVLRLAYGRKGRRKGLLMEALITPKIPADNTAVEKVLQRPVRYSDEWQPPSIVIELMRSQHNNPVLSQLNVRPIKHLEPVIPRKATKGDELSQSRRKNIRKEWYIEMKSNLFPPLPGPELQILKDLTSGEMLWALPKRRKAVGIEYYGRPIPEEILPDFLENGPRKRRTFREYAKGRPHRITLRLMLRLWRRIHCLIPTMHWDEIAKKHYFTWDSAKPMPLLGIPGGAEIFVDVDELGNLTDQSIDPVSSRSKNKSQTTWQPYVTDVSRHKKKYGLQTKWQK
ncbi:hypothetical protein BBP40_006755 [Aspergillus hancockii]|nr:hypothetical protein BBP40_006755 [Aspergillus hancockii]